MRVVPIPGAVDAGLADDIPHLLAKLASDIAEDARAIVPVRTGRLRASIIVSNVIGDNAQVRATAPYAGYVELGTRYMDPQPFLRPATYRYRS